MKPPRPEGAVHVAPNGYHHIKVNGKWTTMGRAVMAHHLGRPLEKHERVKYIDGDPANNDIKNLKLITSKNKSTKARLAVLYAKRDDILAEIKELEQELEHEELSSKA